MQYICFHFKCVTTDISFTLFAVVEALRKAVFVVNAAYWNCPYISLQCHYGEDLESKRSLKHCCTVPGSR